MTNANEFRLLSLSEILLAFQVGMAQTRFGVIREIRQEWNLVPETEFSLLFAPKQGGFYDKLTKEEQEQVRANFALRQEIARHEDILRCLQKDLERNKAIIGVYRSPDKTSQCLRDLYENTPEDERTRFWKVINLPERICETRRQLEVLNARLLLSRFQPTPFWKRRKG